MVAEAFQVFLLHRLAVKAAGFPVDHIGILVNPAIRANKEKNIFAGDGCRSDGAKGEFCGDFIARLISSRGSLSKRRKQCKNKMCGKESILSGVRLILWHPLKTTRHN
jgi:hypothetical protein